ncbi:MAG: acetaldehyde dehydrogenase (acetylating) [Candidatus Binataceae bacterium]|nr:acetaldehyde dehydrogenase (acetylating) [Candidatus Binataceae bacterium]
MASEKVKVAIVGSGNIGTDLMFKIRKSNSLELTWMVGVVPDSDGLRRARELGYQTTHKGIDDLKDHLDDFEIVFDATTAHAHYRHAELLKQWGKIAIDLTPAAVGPYVVPVVNLDQYLDLQNVNLVTCGGQATVPMVHAVSRVTPVKYAEIVSTVASRSAGPGTRQNIDEFTETTARGLAEVGGAERGKAIIVLNPADPPIIMRNTVYVSLEKGADREAIKGSIEEMVSEVQRYVPGYHLKSAPIFDEDRVTILLEVEGAGDYLPKFSGNLDIMTSAAVRVAEGFAGHLKKRKTTGRERHQESVA